MREAGRAEVYNLAKRARIRLTTCVMTVNERVVYMEWVVDGFLYIEKKYGGRQPML